MSWGTDKMLRVAKLIFLMALFLSFKSDSWSEPPTPSPPIVQQPPKSPAEFEQDQPNPYKRGTDQLPLVVKVVGAPKTEAQATQDQQEREDKSASDWWLVKLTGALVVVTALLAIFTALLYAATASLAKDTKESSTEQSDRMERSIAESARVATATEGYNRHATNALKAELRPWMKIASVSPTRLDYNKNTGLNLAANCTYQNVGRSPASFVIVKPTILLSGHQVIPWDYLQEIAKEARPFPNVRQNTIFPNDTGKDEVALNFQQAPMPGSYFVYIGITIFYSFDGFDEIHRTCRLLQICPRASSTPRYDVPVDFAADFNPLLGLVPANVGDYAD